MTEQNLFEYAPALESRSIVDIRSSSGLFVNGEFVDATDGRSFKTISPSTEEVLAEVAEASEADVDLAVKAARRAYTRVWSRMSGRERSKYLFRIARLLQERSREFAVLETIGRRARRCPHGSQRHPDGGNRLDRRPSHHPGNSAR